MGYISLLIYLLTYLLTLDSHERHLAPLWCFSAILAQDAMTYLLNAGRHHVTDDQRALRRLIGSLQMMANL